MGGQAYQSQTLPNCYRNIHLDCVRHPTTNMYPCHRTTQTVTARRPSIRPFHAPNRSRSSFLHRWYATLNAPPLALLDRVCQCCHELLSCSCSLHTCESGSFFIAHVGLHDLSRTRERKEKSNLLDISLLGRVGRYTPFPFTANSTLSLSPSKVVILPVESSSILGHSDALRTSLSNTNSSMSLRSCHL
jgi:hypothetical protein